MPPARIESAHDAVPLEIAPGIYMRLPALLTAEDSPSPGLRTRIEFLFDFDRREVQAATVAVQSQPGGDSVTGTDLRAVKVAELTAEYVPTLAMKHDGSPVQPAPDEIAELVSRGPSNGATIQLVADLYLYADAVGLRPAKHVQEVLGLPPATASRWIRRAREARLFESAVVTIEGVVDGDD